jgi:putative tricarboxylic transport membrane protein
MIRSFVTAAVCAALFASSSAFALDTVKIMIGANPGGGYDKTGRALGKALQDSGQAKSVQYDNKAGANGTIALAQFASSAKGDPNALFVVGAFMVGTIVQNNTQINLSNVTPVAKLLVEYNMFVVPANSPFKSMKDVVDQMKKEPGSVKWGGAVKGSLDHLSVAMIARETGVPVTKVNYIPLMGGGETVSSVLGGHVSVGVGGYSELMQYVTSGKMRALAVTSPNRLHGSSIPTLREQGINLDIGNWRGVYGAAGITPAQRQALVDAVAVATKHKSWEDALKTNEWLSAQVVGDEFKKFVDAEHERLRGIAKDLDMIK